jgi:NADPH-dependent 2,4-dienoyl-CoA reductase/sulfur reductase-like enzyme
MGQPRVIVIGAGPAGVRCAQTLVAAGLRPIVVDENRRDGGQIYRRQPDNFTRPYAKLYGTEGARAEALHTSFDALRAKVDYMPETLAWNIFGGKLHVVRDQRSRALPYDALVICSGATDRLMPVKGWHYAGTYSLGAAQIALKAQACAIGRRVVFMGSGPLLYLVASQYLQAGAGVGAVLDTSPAGKPLAALTGLLARPRGARRGRGQIRGRNQSGVPGLQGVAPQASGGD